MLGHLVRRGVAAVQELQSHQNEVENFHFTTAAKVTFSFLFVYYLFQIFVIRYVYGEVVATLAMVETPTTIIAVNADADEPDSPLPLAEEKESEKVPFVQQKLVVVRAKPLTSSVRKIISHLRARSGLRGPFRGLGAFLLYQGLFYIEAQAVNALTYPLNFFGPGYVAAIIAAVLNAPLNMFWTHSIISEKPPAQSLRLLFNLSTFKKIAPATGLKSFAEQLTLALPTALYQIYDLESYVQDPSKLVQLNRCARMAVGLQALSVVGVCIGTALLILVPATVTLTRIQASLLPEEHEAVVPFDRTFSGKFTPERLGGSGKLGLLEAWKTFNWPARRNLLKIYARVALAQVALDVFMGVRCYAALTFFMGDVLDKAWVVVSARVQRQSMKTD